MFKTASQTLLALLLLLTPSKGQNAKVGVFGNGTSVYGLAHFNGYLHVVREETAHVEVYDASSAAFQRMQPLQALNKTGYYDMAVLPKAKVLVLLNWFDGRNVIMMNMAPPYNITKWPFTTIDSVAAVSATDVDERIVITVSASKSLKVFTKEGVLLREIFLKTVMSPRHAIRTVDNLYAVTFGYSRKEPHYVCRFNVLGFVVGRCFGGRPGNSDKQLDVPARMINSKDGGILVADMNNRRVIKLTRDLKSLTEVVTQADGLNQPYRIEYYPEGQTLYVADNFLDPVTLYSIGGRIMAFRYVM